MTPTSTAALEWMTARWDAGMTVSITTHYRSIQIAPTRRSAVRINAGGDLQVMRGRGWDTILIDGVRITANK